MKSLHNTGSADAFDAESVFAWLDRAIDVLTNQSDAKEYFSRDIEWLEERRQTWENHVWHIALIGITSSGKSTLVNALLDFDFLPTGVAPTSNVPILCQRSDDTRPKCRIFYEGESEPEEIRDAIRERLALLGDEKNNPENREGVKEIHVFSPRLLFAEDVLIIDTPGLDGYGLERHDRLTLDWLLPRVDAVVFLVDCRSTKHAQLAGFLERVRIQEKPLVLVQTRVDAVQAKLGLRDTIVKTKAEVRSEFADAAKSLLKTCMFPPETPVVQVSAIEALRGQVSESGMGKLVEAVSADLSKKRPELIKGRLNQLSTELARIVNRNAFQGDIDERRHRVRRDRTELSRLRKSFDLVGTTLESSVEDAIKAAERRLARIEHESSKLSTSNEDLERARAIDDKLKTLVAKCSESFSDSVRNCETSFREIGDTLNLTEEDFRLPQAPIKRMRAIRIPKDTRSRTTRRPQPGFGGWVGRIFGGGYDEETHTWEVLNPDAFREMLATFSTEHRDWMRKVASVAIVKSARERGGAISAELERRECELNEQARFQVADETRHKVAEKIQVLLTEIQCALGSGSATTSPDALLPDMVHESPPERVDSVDTATGYSSTTDCLLRLAARVSHLRRIAQRGKALRLASKRLAPPNLNHNLIVGFDRDAIERFINLFWSDVSGASAPIAEGFNDLGEGPTYGRVAVLWRDGNDRKVGCSEAIARFLSAAATVFLIIDLEQIGSTMNQISRSRIMECLRRNIGLILVVQSVRGLQNAGSISEAVKELRDVLVREFEMSVDAILANDSSTLVTKLIDAFFERGAKIRTVQDEQRLLSAIASNEWERRRAIALLPRLNIRVNSRLDRT